MINEIIVAEESDVVPGGGYASHFELYLMAMKEVGADVGPVEAFVSTVRAKGWEAALSLPTIPEPARAFMRDTYSLISTGQAHRVAASFAFGRENVIPGGI